MRYIKTLNIFFIIIFSIISVRISILFFMFCLPFYFNIPIKNNKIYNIIFVLYCIYLDLFFLTFIFSLIPFFYFFKLNIKNFIYLIFPLLVITFGLYIDKKLKYCNDELVEFIDNSYSQNTSMPYEYEVFKYNSENCNLILNKNFFINSTIKYYRVNNDEYLLKPMGFFYNYLYFE